MNRYLLTKREFGQAIHLGSTKVHEMVRSGEVRSVRIGTAVRIPATEVDALVARLLTVGVEEESACREPEPDVAMDVGPGSGHHSGRP